MDDGAALPRFYVIETRGWPILPGSTGGVAGSQPEQVSFAVLDRVFCHREVATFYPSLNGRPPEMKRRACALALAVELNAGE